MTKSLLITISLLLVALFASSQNSVSIYGTVKDAKGEILPGAGIYLSGYKIAAVSDNSGKFILANLNPGNYDVLIQMMGFLPFSKNVVISDKSIIIEATLHESITQLKEVVINIDPNRQKYINLFKDRFIGKTPNAEKCKILNPEVLVTEYDKARRILKVTADEFLIVENQALGYRIKYLLKYFENDFNSNIIFFSGMPHFEELKGSKSKKKKWLKNREIAYAGSTQHFFKSLYNNKTKEEGFIIYKLREVENKNRLADKLIDYKIKLFTSQSRTAFLTDSSNDSLIYWQRKKNEPKTVEVLNRAEVLTDTLVKTIYKDLKTINYNDALYIMFTKERETKLYTSTSGHSVGRPTDIPNYQISVMTMIDGPANFYAVGAVQDPKSLLYSGFWGYEKVADMVPLDYTPSQKSE
jgi:hypothetical protein